MLQITEAAYEEIKRLLKGQGKPNGGLRIGVLRRSKSCGGTSFTLNFVEEPAPEETVLKVREVNLLLDAEARELLDEYVLDFNEGMFSGGFRFINSAAGHTCRCGRSIAV